MSTRRHVLPAFFAGLALLVGAAGCTNDDPAVAPRFTDASGNTAGISLVESPTPTPNDASGGGSSGAEPGYAGGFAPLPRDLPGVAPGVAGPDTPVSSPPLSKPEPTPGVIAPLPPDRAPDYPPNQTPPTPITPDPRPRPMPTGTPDQPIKPMPIDPSMKRVLAPIEAVDMRIAESYPPQYFVAVTSGLPSGCAKFDHYTVERDGDTIQITVWNTMPSDPRVACTMIYGYIQHNIALGSDFQSGRTYHLKVNDVTTSFTAQ